MKRFVILIFAVLPIIIHANPRKDSLEQVLRELPALDTARVSPYILLGDIHSKGSDVDSALYYFEKALEVAQKAQFSKGECETYIKFSDHFARYNQQDEAEIYLDSALSIAETTNDSRNQFFIVLKKGVNQRKLGNLEEATKLYHEAIKIASDAELPELVANGYNALGICEYYRGNHVQGLKHLYKSAEWYEKLGNHNKLASLYNNIGILYHGQKDYVNSIKVHKKSLEMLENLNLTPPSIYKSLINLSIAYSSIEQHDSAIFVLKKSVDISKKSDNMIFHFHSWTVLARTYSEIKDFEHTVEACKEAIKVAEGLQSKWYVGDGKLQLAATYNQMAAYDSALQQLNDLKPLDEENAQAIFRIRLNNEFNKAYRGLEQYEKAIENGESSVELATNAKMKSWIATCTHQMYVTYRAAGDFQNALYFYERYKINQDSVNNEQNTLEIGRLQARAEAQKEKQILLDEQKLKEVEIEKQKVIRDMLLFIVFITAIFAFLIYHNYRKKVIANKMLRKMNDEIHEQKEEIETQREDLIVKNEELELLNHEKNALIGIVAHDLRSPLNKNMGLAALVKMEGNLTESQNECLDTVDKVCKDGLRLIEEIFYLHTIEQEEEENQLEKVNINDFVTSQMSGYHVLAEKKQLNLSFEQPEMPIYAMIDTCYLSRVVDNLVTNAIKYTHKGKNILVSLENCKSTFKIKIKDEGQGFSKEDQKKMFNKFQKLSAKPTAGESSTGLGLSIVKSLIEKMKGKISFESKQGTGTEFTLEFNAILDTSKNNMLEVKASAA